MLGLGLGFWWGSMDELGSGGDDEGFCCPRRLSRTNEADRLHMILDFGFCRVLFLRVFD